MMDLSDFNSVISQEVVNNEWQVVKAGIETKDSAIVV
jgi:hypothetical protein